MLILEKYLSHQWYLRYILQNEHNGFAGLEGRIVTLTVTEFEKAQPDISPFRRHCSLCSLLKSLKILQIKLTEQEEFSH